MIPLAVVVENRSGADVIVARIVALIADAENHPTARVTLADQQPLQRAASTTYRGVILGPWPADAVLGVCSWFTSSTGEPRASSCHCQPLCLTCDHQKSNAACERVSALASSP